jgi:hypothetical protein
LNVAVKFASALLELPELALPLVLAVLLEVLLVRSWSSELMPPPWPCP